MSGKDTLDHRSLLGAILGTPGIGGLGRESVSDALQRVRGFGASLVDEYHSSLVAAFESGHCSTDLYECAVVLGLADLDQAQERGLDVLAYAVHSAHAHQRAGRPERALEICDLVASCGLLSAELTRISGECQALERRRRHSRDQEVLYARRCLALGQEDAARHHLERALDWDPDSREAAELLAGLERNDGRRRRSGSRARILALGLIAIGLPIGAVSMAHARAAREYEALQRPMPQDLLALERRIDELEGFAEAHQLWWGRDELDQELLELQEKRNTLESTIRESNSIAELERAAAENRIDATYQDARTAVETGRPHEALEMLENALASGVPSPQTRARLRRDIAAIRELLAEGGERASAVDAVHFESNETAPSAPPDSGVSASPEVGQR